MFRLNNYLVLIITGLSLLFSSAATALAAPAGGNDEPSTTVIEQSIGQYQGTDQGFRYEPTGYVTVPNLNVRSGPGTNYPVFTVIHYNQPVTLISRNSSTTWFRIRLAAGQEGWVMVRYIYADPEDIAHLPAYDPDPSPIPVEAIGYVTTPYLNVRTGPGLDQPVIGRLWQGERVALLGRNTNGAWLQVRLASNSKGWVSSRYIQSSVPIYTLPVTEVGIPEPLPINGYVTAPTLNLRSGPGLYYNIVGRLNQGQQVSVYGRDITGEWYKVGLANGAQGWVASRYIQLPVAAAELKVL